MNSSMKSGSVAAITSTGRRSTVIQLARVAWKIMQQDDRGECDARPSRRTPPGRRSRPPSGRSRSRPPASRAAAPRQDRRPLPAIGHPPLKAATSGFVRRGNVGCVRAHGVSCGDRGCAGAWAPASARRSRGPPRPCCDPRAAAPRPAALRQLQRAHVGDHRPALFDRQLGGVGGHHAEALGDDLVDVAGRPIDVAVQRRRRPQRHLRARRCCRRRRSGRGRCRR